MNLYQPTISGSLTVSGSVVVDGTIVMSSGSISGTASLALNSLLLNGLNSGSFVGTGSYNTFSGSVSSRLVTQENASGSFAAQSASLSTRVTNLEATSSTVSSSFASTSGSLSSRVTIIEGQDATTGSNNFTAPQQISDVSNAISFTSTASLYTDGGLRVTKDSFISGTAYFNNVVVYGTSSIQYITSSQVNIGTNIITVNTDTPAVRFGGLAVYDSGSTALTGSLLWDSQNNRWVYSNPSGSTYDGGMLISGPRNTTGLGNEQGTTLNALMRGQGGDHITSSLITDDGSTLSIPYALTVTGSIVGSSSNRLGSSISDVQRMTGSVNVTGSFSVTTTATELQVGATGVTLGNALTDVHQVTGSLRVTGSGNHFIQGGNVGIGTSSPTRLVDISGSAGVLRVQNAGSVGAPSIELGVQNQGSGLFAPAANTVAITTNDTERLRITSGGNFQVTGSATFSSTIIASSTISTSTLSLGTDGTYGSNYRTLGLTGTTNGTHRIFAGTSDDLFVAAATGRGVAIWTDGSSGYKMYVNSTGSVGIGTQNPSARLDVAWGGYQTQGGAINIGADIGNLTSRTNNATKYGIVSGVPYTTTDKPIELITYFSNNTTKSIGIGGQGNTDFAGVSNIAFLTTSSLTQPGTTRMVIDSSGNVGIGISPSYRLHANSGIDGISAGIAGSTYGIRFDNGGTFSSGMSTIHGVNSTLIGSYQPIMLNGSEVRFGTSATEQARITSEGYLRLVRAGIQFNNDTADANSLDDYEEGSFTPTSLSSDFSSITPVFGRYIKIGSQVTINCRWTVTPGGTGKKYLVFNLPFAFADNGNVSFTGAVSNYNEGLSAYSSNVGTTVRNSSGSTTQQYVEAVYISTTANSTLLLSMTYFTFF